MRSRSAFTIVRWVPLISISCYMSKPVHVAVLSQIKMAIVNVFKHAIFQNSKWRWPPYLKLRQARI